MLNMKTTADQRASVKFLPEGFTLHVLVCKTVVSQGLIPCGVTSVSQGLCAKFVGLFVENQIKTNA